MNREFAYRRGTYHLIDRKEKQMHFKCSQRDLEMLKALSKHKRMTQAKIVRDFIQAEFDKITKAALPAFDPDVDYTKINQAPPFDPEDTKS